MTATTFETDTRILGLPPISLDDVTEAAGLLTRLDRKYLIQADLLAELYEATEGFQILTIDGLSCFTYESVYFDTQELLSFSGAVTGRRRRFKVRTRRYLESELCFVEVKTQGIRDTTVKVRCAHPFHASLDLSPSVSFADRCLDGRTNVADLHPLLRTSYRRATLANTARGERVTIDVDVTAELVNGQRSIDLSSWVVVETKSGSAATSVDRWLWSRGIRPSRVSKFGTSLAMMEPTLPRNKWHRTIQRLA